MCEKPTQVERAMGKEKPIVAERAKVHEKTRGKKRATDLKEPIGRERAKTEEKPMSGKRIKLHIGCGKRYLSGFYHIDLANYKHIDYKCDTRKLTMFNDSSVDLIYASHVLEYFDSIEAKHVLKEWHRVLKYGGILRVAIPDFEALVKVYNKYKDIELILGPLYGRWNIKGTEFIVYHKAVYDFKSLKKLLDKTGFANIKRWNWRDVFVGEHSMFDDYSQAYIPHLDREHGILISLNVEAMKL